MPAGLVLQGCFGFAQHDASMIPFRHLSAMQWSQRGSQMPAGLVLQGCFGFAQHDASEIPFRHPERNAMEPKGLPNVGRFGIAGMLRLCSARRKRDSVSSP